MKKQDLVKIRRAVAKRNYERLGGGVFRAYACQRPVRTKKKINTKD